MPMSYLLSLLVFSVGLVATLDRPSTAARLTDDATSGISSPGYRARPDAAHSGAMDMVNDGNTPLHPRGVPTSGTDHQIAVGETLPDFVELHPIPKHETYRHAIVNNNWVIVDAASRKVIYIVR
jgi:hypothetical protein